MPGCAAISSAVIVVRRKVRISFSRSVSTPATWTESRLDVLADNAHNSAATGLLMTDPAAYAETVSGGRGIAQMEEANCNFVSLPSALDAYRTFFLDLIDEKRTGAALFHCAPGRIEPDGT